MGTPKVVFIVVAPRSGGGLLLDLLALDPRFAWVPSWVNARPDRLGRSLGIRAYELPLIGRYLYVKKERLDKKMRAWIHYSMPIPREPWNFWNNLISQFSRPPHRDDKLKIGPECVTKEERERARLTIKKICDVTRRPNFVSLYAENDRMELLRSIFPEAYFVHVARDPKAGVMSFHHEVKEGRYLHWSQKDQFMDCLSDAERAAIESAKDPQFTFCALLYRKYVEGIREGGAKVGSKRYYEIQYEELGDSPLRALEKVYEFLDLPLAPVLKNLEWYVQASQVRNRNLPWLQQGDAIKLSQIEEFF